MKLPLIEALAVRTLDYCLAPSTNASLSPSTYHEAYRPQVHYSPSAGFMNDPNGLLYDPHTQRWHMSYQYNPYATEAGLQHWGHAVSDDLLHWQNYQPAITPPSENLTVLSGSAVIDAENTSGLFNASTAAQDRFVALYTELDQRGEQLWQRQKAAYSVDGGYRYNIVDEPVLDINQTEFRDPKVFRDKSGDRWIMSVVLASQYKVVWYASANLLEWEYLNEFTGGYPAYQYECPDLLEVPVIEAGQQIGTKHLLILSIQPGAPRGGSAAQYFIGDLAADFTFTPDDSLTRFLSFGLDDYATVSFGGELPAGHPPTIVGWAQNWAYVADTPTGAYRSSMTIPRELSIVRASPTDQYTGYYLRQQPIDLEPVMGSVLTNTTDTTKEGSIALSGDASDLHFTFNGSAKGLYDDKEKPYAEVQILNEDESSVVKIHIDYAIHTIYVNRGQSGWGVDTFVNYAGETFRPPSDGIVSFRAVLDRSLLEIFAQDGLHYASNVFYMRDRNGEADVPAKIRYVTSESVNVTQVSVQSLNSVWNVPDCDGAN